MKNNTLKLLFSFLLIISFFYFQKEKVLAADSSIIEYYRLNSSSRNAGINSDNQVSGGNEFISGRSGLTGDNSLKIYYWQGANFNLANAAKKTITDGFSACFWHKQDSGGNESRLDFNFGGVGGGGGGLGPYNPPGFSPPSGTNGCSSSNTTWGGSSSIGATFNDGNWHQICYTASDTQTKMYMDGAEFYSCNHLDFPTWGDFTSVNFSYTNWPGAIDDLITFNKKLSAEEVLIAYQTENVAEMSFQAPTPPCESYTYTDWSVCDPDGYQVRNIDTKFPTNCEGGASPSLWRTCEFGSGNGSAPDDGTGLFFSNPYSFSFNSTAIVRYDYNEDVFTPYDYLEIRQMSSDWLTSTFISTSTIINLDLGKTGGKSFFTLLGNASTTGLTYYDVIPHFSAYWSPTIGDVPATTTIPYVVAVDWHPTEIPSLADILAASSTNPFYDDSAMYYAACSQEEWQTAPPSIFGVDVPALNLTVIGCKFKLGFIIAGNKFTTIVTDGFYRAGNILKGVFPFNIYTNLNSSWKASANATVISELSFLSPVNGNLTAQIPTTGTSTASIVLWGKDIFTSSSTIGTNNAQKTSQLFLAIKTIIKWALWGLFGLWAIKNGKAFIEKMTGGQ